MLKWAGASLRSSDTRSLLMSLMTSMKPKDPSGSSSSLPAFLGGGKPKNFEVKRGRKPVGQRQVFGRRAGGPSETLDSIINAGVDTYKCTKAYNEAKKCVYNKDGLSKINHWIMENASNIDPSEQKFCSQCGDVQLKFCEHMLIGDVEVEISTGVKREVVIQPRKEGWISAFYSWWNAASEFDLQAVNNRLLRDFDNSSFSDELIDRDLYTYLTLNMQTDYTYAGVDNRQLRLAHCHRLMLRYVEIHSVKMDVRMKNVCMLTVQRACDNAEHVVLYKYTDPVQNFWPAWWVQFFRRALLVLALISVCVVALIFLDLNAFCNQSIAVVHNLGSTLHLEFLSPIGRMLKYVLTGVVQQPAIYALALVIFALLGMK